MGDQLTGLLSPFLRSRRIAAAKPFLGAGRILDIGCGTGELARHVESDRYLGVDQDQESIAIARKNFPNHQFFTVREFSRLPERETFEQIVALAVIEHVNDPEQWLGWLRALLRAGGSLILTTPHPAVRRVHELGARIGLFSRAAAEEHGDFLDRGRIEDLAGAAGFTVRKFRRFLLGANQLVLLEPDGNRAISR
ncbi:MAG TPA: class I SAM-dependent methyltransferase [Chthoniobacterales bacterium]|nr:class I SAM-dependent methyltransferase [Chthoniobacterales bacterium]